MADQVCELCGSDLPKGVSECEHEGDTNECLICKECACSQCIMCNTHCECSDEPESEENDPDDDSD
uniref:Uncharacterized protein n=1 Tax=viral metagenome TaxID=1070528 RepID=A0A6C0CIZ6_9ZZZZ